MTALAPILEAFFTDRLAALRASPHTIAAYRDTYRLLLVFTQQRTGTPPSRARTRRPGRDDDPGVLRPPRNRPAQQDRTRNLRLTAIHSLFRYAALRCPEHSAVIQQVLAIPSKRPDVPLVTFLTRAETDALLAAPDRDSALGRRDHLLLAVGIQTGLRVSELTGLTWADVAFGVGAHLRCDGKGRKERCTPLTKSTAKLLAASLSERRAAPSGPGVPHRDRSSRLSTDAVADLLAKHVATATASCPTLARKTITPHTLRHTCAMNLLQAGVDTSSIALWLGHATTKSTDTYLHADLAMKEKALARTAPATETARRYKPPDRLLAFLEAL